MLTNGSNFSETKSIMDSKDRVFCTSIDVIFNFINMEIQYDLPKSNTIAVQLIINDIVAIICLIGYIIYASALSFIPNLFGNTITFIRVYVFYQIITFASTLILQKISFTINLIEYYFLYSYPAIPLPILCVFEKINKVQYPLFWFLTSAHLTLQMIKFTLQSVRVQHLYYMLCSTVGILLIFVFISSTTQYIVILMLAVSFIIWWANKHHAIAQLYSQGMTRTDVTNCQKIRKMTSIQIILGIAFHVSKLLYTFIINHSINNEVNKIFHQFVMEEVFSIIQSITSILNLILFLWATSDYFYVKNKETNVLPVTVSESAFNMSSTSHSRRPSTFSTYSLAVSPTPTANSLSPHHLHI